MALISLHEVSLGYGEMELFNSLSFQLEPGELWTLLIFYGISPSLLEAFLKPHSMTRRVKIFNARRVAPIGRERQNAQAHQPVL